MNFRALITTGEPHNHSVKSEVFNVPQELSVGIAAADPYDMQG